MLAGVGTCQQKGTSGFDQGISTEVKVYTHPQKSVHPHTHTQKHARSQSLLKSWQPKKTSHQKHPQKNTHTHQQWYGADILGNSQTATGSVLVEN